MRLLRLCTTICVFIQEFIHDCTYITDANNGFSARENQTNMLSRRQTVDDSIHKALNSLSSVSGVTVQDEQISLSANALFRNGKLMQQPRLVDVDRLTWN